MSIPTEKPNKQSNNGHHTTPLEIIKGTDRVKSLSTTSFVWVHAEVDWWFSVGKGSRHLQPPLREALQFGSTLCQDCVQN